MFSFKSGLVRIFSPPLKDPKVWEKIIPFWKKKKTNPPDFCFLKFYAVASILTMKEHYEGTASHFGQVCFYMTMVFF